MGNRDKSLLAGKAQFRERLLFLRAIRRIPSLRIYSEGRKAAARKPNICLESTKILSLLALPLGSALLALSLANFSLSLSGKREKPSGGRDTLPQCTKSAQSVLTIATRPAASASLLRLRRLKTSLLRPFQQTNIGRQRESGSRTP